MINEDPTTETQDELEETAELPEEEVLVPDTTPLPSLSTVEPPTIEVASLPQPPTINLPSLASKNKSKPRLKSAQRCDVGSVRERNQDSCFAFVSHTGGHETIPPFGLFIVSDGMGGHFDGDVASKRVTRMVANHILSTAYLPLLQDTSQSAPVPIHELLEDAAQKANEALHIPDPNKEMGTTLTAALIFGRRLYMVHVGDSRAYLIQEGKMEQITTDHSVVSALQEAGQLSPEEAAVHPNRNLLYRALMGAELEVDTFSRSLPKKGSLLLCSDGLWGLVSDEAMQGILDESISLQEKVNKLVDHANLAGGHDNITVILIDLNL